MAGPDLGGAQAALDGGVAGLVQRPDRVGTWRRCGPLVVLKPPGLGDAAVLSRFARAVSTLWLTSKGTIVAAAL